MQCCYFSAVLEFSGSPFSYCRWSRMMLIYFWNLLSNHAAFHEMVIRHSSFSWCPWTKLFIADLSTYWYHTHWRFQISFCISGLNNYLPNNKIICKAPRSGMSPQCVSLVAYRHGLYDDEYPDALTDSVLSFHSFVLSLFRRMKKEALWPIQVSLGQCYLSCRVTLSL